VEEAREIMKNRYAMEVYQDHHLILRRDSSYSSPLWYETDANLEPCVNSDGVPLWKVVAGVHAQRTQAEIDADVVHNRNATMEQKGAAGIISLLDYKSWKKAECSTISETMIFSKFPLWKQNSVVGDKEYGVNTIRSFSPTAGGNLSSDDITGKAMAKITFNDLVSLKQAYETPDDIVITDIVNEFPQAARSHVRRSYRRVIQGIVVYLLIKKVRDWCDETQGLITDAATKEDVYGITLTGCPVL
jgi:hypothetical protein